MNRIDHLMYAVPSIEAGTEWAQDLFGAAPAYGGAHVGLGTCNALLSLGSTYLELIAPDPEQQAVLDSGRGLGAQICELSQGGLVTWAVQGELLKIQADLAELSIATIGPRKTERQTTEGELLVWELLFPGATQFGPRMPFFIDWLECPHPSRTNPMGGTLRALQICSPASQELDAVLTNLGLSVQVSGGADALAAVIDTKDGEVVLHSTAETSAIKLG